MADIALRDYNQEIDTIINNGRLNEAIAHCLYILKIYPKHITSYRQLGNAFLEAKRYGDALDIFQRLLATVPDDFIANLGMSIIREDEGNLDAAIWFMERAFEQKPSNKAIQDELRKLFGKRDQVEPPKIRLTRGALARMYARGDQILQAIAEIEAALREDPQRPDLQVLLANMYHQAGKDNEVLEICKVLLNKLPDCFEGNRLLAILLEKAGKVEEARPYRERVNALDPYESKVSPQTPSTDQVPSDAIILPKLDLPVEQLTAASSQPAWAASLGIAASSILSGQEEVPEWMKSTGEPQGEEPVEEETSSFDLATSKEQALEAEEELPVWMKEAGWSPATDNALEESKPADESEFPAEQEGEIPQAELPDWLKAIDPEAILEREKSEGTAQEDATLAALLSEAEPSSADVKNEENIQVESIPDWLKSLGDDGTSEASIPAPQVEPEPVQPTSAEEKAPAAAPVDLPVWLNETQPGPSDTIGSWLSGKQPQPKEPVTEPAEPKPASDDSEELPEWLRDFSKEELPKPENQAVEASVLPILPIPLPLKPESFMPPNTPVEEGLQATVISDQTRETVPDWVKSFTETPPTETGQALEGMRVSEGAPSAETNAESASEDELPEWLRSYAEGEKSSAGTSSDSIPAEDDAALLTSAGGEDLPEWLSDPIAKGTPTTAPPVEPAPSEAIAKGEPVTESIPDWLSSFTDEETPTQAVPTGAQPEPEALPDWLSRLEEETLADSPTEVASAKIPAEAVSAEAQSEPEDMPDWLSSFIGDETPAESVPAKAQPEPEALPDWLSRLEEETPAEIPTEITAAELPAETVPSETQPTPEDFTDRLSKTEGVTATEEDATESPAEAIPVKAHTESEALPDWLSSLDEEGNAEPAIAPDAELPDWLSSITEPEQPPVVQATEPAPADGTILPVDHEAASTAKAESISPEGQPVAEFESPPDFEDMDAAIAWLENMAVSHISQTTPTPAETSVPKPELTPALATPSEQLPLTTEAELSETMTQENTEPVAVPPGPEAFEPESIKSVWIPESELEGLAEQAPPVIPPFQGTTPPVQPPPTEESASSAIAVPQEQEISTAEIPSVPTEQPIFTEDAGIQPVNMNTASLIELERLPGIGFRLAQNIINYRQTQGPFEKVDDLVNILNVGPDAFSQMKDYLTIETSPLTASPQPSRVYTQEAPPAQVSAAAWELLSNAQAARLQGQFPAALEHYEQLIKSRVLLDQVIQDLTQMIIDQPGEYLIHQALGDAYLRCDRLQEAMDAYTTAENLLT